MIVTRHFVVFLSVTDREEKVREERGCRSAGSLYLALLLSPPLSSHCDSLDPAPQHKMLRCTATLTKTTQRQRLLRPGITNKCVWSKIRHQNAAQSGYSEEKKDLDTIIQLMQHTPGNNKNNKEQRTKNRPPFLNPRLSESHAPFSTVSDSYETETQCRVKRLSLLLCQELH